MPIFSYEHCIDPVLKNIRQMIPGFSGMKAGDKVLDVCCGTGAQVVEYGKRGITAIGVDNEASMLAIGIENKEELGLRNISFVVADAAALPFEGGSFDYVSISFGLHDKEECIRKAVIEEIKRVVKPGGSIILIDFAIPLPGNLWAWLARIIEFMAGGSHYQGFKNFKANGGLKSIMSNHNLARQRTGLFKSGLVEVVQAGLLAEKGNYNRQTGLGG